MIDFSTLQGLTIPEGAVTKIEDSAGNVLWILPTQDNYCLTFSSPNTFSISASAYWDGVIEYSTNCRTWNTWDGSQISGIKLYFRGSNNSRISSKEMDYGTISNGWKLTGTDISCTGNIETLLDYSTVESGEHPTMAPHCCASMFYGCTSLTQAPELPATTLSSYCYQSMFQGCTSLSQAPELPATTLSEQCYQSMFYGCTSLKLSATQTDEYIQEYRIPTTGTGTESYDALYNMFERTGGTFTGTPSINTTYYGAWD